jgi:hypothetical protein
MSPGWRGWSAVFLVLAMACHRPREMAPQIPLEGIDGKYTFTISNPFKMEGQFLVAYSRVYLITPKRCVPIEGPRASDEMRAAWFECNARGQAGPGDASLRLRISEIDPVNHSRWYQRTTVMDTVLRCTRYQASGDCVELLRARGRKWVDRNGSMTVERGWPARADTGRTPDPSGRGQLRVRCDTSATPGACAPDARKEGE